MKDLTKIFGIGITAVGIYSANKTAQAHTEQIELKREYEEKKLEHLKQVHNDNVALENKRLDLQRDQLEFEKFKYYNTEKVSDYNDQFKSTFEKAKSLETINNSTDQNININSPLETDISLDINEVPLETSKLLVENMSLTFICFTSVTIFLTISMTFTYLTYMYGDKLLDRLPKILHPLYRFYQKYLLFPILFDFSIILVCQIVGLTLSLYIYLT